MYERYLGIFTSVISFVHCVGFILAGWEVQTAFDLTNERPSMVVILMILMISLTAMFSGKAQNSCEKGRDSH